MLPELQTLAIKPDRAKLKQEKKMRREKEKVKTTASMLEHSAGPSYLFWSSGRRNFLPVLEVHINSRGNSCL